jgi:hypothetical protein
MTDKASRRVMPAQWPPIEPKKEGEKLTGILIHEDWYDRLHPIYKYGKQLAGSVTIEKVPLEFKKPAELIRDLVIEFGSNGWVFSLSIISVLLWAAHKAIEVGKFTYQKISHGSTYGGSHGATYGGSSGCTLGGSTIQVKEISE